MRSENPATWACSSVASPADLHPSLAEARKLDGVVEAAGKAMNCKSAMLYRHTKTGLTLAAGSGPAKLGSRRLNDAFGKGNGDVADDFVQFSDDELKADACAKLGLRGGPRACFAAAAQVWHDGTHYGVLIVADEAPSPLLSPAQSYVLRAFAGHIAALFELKKVHGLAIATDQVHLAKIEQLRLFESVAVHARDSILITEAEPIDLPGPRILYCNAAFTATTGYSAAEVIGQTPRLLQGPKTDPAACAKLREALANWQPIEIEVLNYRKDGSEFWVELSIVPVASEQGWYTHWISVQRDVTERKRTEALKARVEIVEVQNEALASEIEQRKRIEAELLYTAFHDNLTRLRNRAFFMGRLAAVLKRRKNEPVKACSVLFLDLDRFKIVNDSLGHQAGDMLLQEVSRRLKSCARPQDTLARFGGDEFAFLIDDAAELSVAVGIAERIIEVLRAPIRLGKQDVFASCSIGIVQSSERCSHPEAIIRDADVAMYVAKRSGVGVYAVFDESMVADATAALGLESDLQLAVDRGEFELAYQPIVDPENGRIKGFEALIRWQHPTRGPLQPDQFVPVAQEIGLIRRIDRWVLHTACAQLGKWRAQFAPLELSMSVNTSASELDDPSFVEDLKSTLVRFNLPACALELEITESVLLNSNHEVSSVIAEIRKHGVRVGLDDFGTGYSSLSYLNRYVTDTIKIDKSFIMSLCTDDRTLAIVLLIIQLAKTLDVDVVAEGVETEEQAQLLASMSCTRAQGYYFSRPVTADAATILMASSMSLVQNECSSAFADAVQRSVG